MIDRNTPSDPRYRERRGDLVGRSALLFAIVLVLVMGTAVFVLLGGMSMIGGLAGSASPSRSPTPSLSPTPHRTPTPAPTGSPTPAPSPTAQTSTIGTPATLAVDGQPVATVLVRAPGYPRRVNGDRAPAGQRWAVVPITLTAAVPLEYRAADWQALDASGAGYAWTLNDPPPALGSGTATAGVAVTGHVTFLLPAGSTVAAMVLRDEAGTPLMTLRAP